MNSKKKTILHLIDDLGRGGAETMLVAVLKELHEYRNIVVTLYDNNHFTDHEFKCDEFISLQLNSIAQLPLAALRLRQIIESKEVDLVHSHLIWSTILARVSVPPIIPLLSTIHSSASSAPEYKLRRVKYLDQLTYHLRKSIMVGVAQGPLDDYFSFLKLTPHKKYTLYTFVNNRVFDISKPKPPSTGPRFRLISVGRIAPPKNQKYLVDAFKLLPKEKFELHIYGVNREGQAFEDYVKASGANVVLKGEVKNINEVMQSYDAFVMSSTSEGFSLAVLEAMAMGMPMLLSDIPSFREQCAETAAYFDLRDPRHFALKVLDLTQNLTVLNELGRLAKQRAVQNFTIDHHLTKLRKIYTEST
jgi:L-malate glycosyltransferase